MSRATWDEAWMAVADDIAQRSPCVRMQCGAVIADVANRIVATGYNGFPAQRKTNPITCDAGALRNEVQLVARIDPAVSAAAELRLGKACPRAIHGPQDSHVYTDCFSVHAEANALLFCDRRDREGGTIYCTTNPCWECAKLIANAGLSRVVARSNADYRPTDQVAQLFADCFIEFVRWES